MCWYLFLRKITIAETSRLVSIMLDRDRPSEGTHSLCSGQMDDLTSWLTDTFRALTPIAFPRTVISDRHSQFDLCAPAPIFLRCNVHMVFVFLLPLLKLGFENLRLILEIDHDEFYSSSSIEICVSITSIAGRGQEGCSGTYSWHHEQSSSLQMSIGIGFCH